MVIRDVVAEIEAAADLADEAWELASQAKEKAAEARVKLHAIAGSTPPKLLAEAHGLLVKAHATFESGQANCTAAQDRMREYMALINE